MIRVTKAVPALLMVTSIFLIVTQIFGFVMYRRYVSADDDNIAVQVDWLLSQEKYAVSALNMLGFFLLILSLVILYMKFANQSGLLGFISFAIALLGSCLMYGDAWFEAFITPMMAQLAPTQTVGQFTPSLIIGALSTFILFGFGWCLFGFSLLVKKCIPWPLSVLLMISALYGWQALSTPKLVPFAIVLGAIGYYLFQVKPLDKVSYHDEDLNF